MVGREGVLGTAGTTAGADGITGMAGVLGTGVAGVTTGAGIVAGAVGIGSGTGADGGVVGGLTGVETTGVGGFTGCGATDAGFGLGSKALPTFGLELGLRGGSVVPGVLSVGKGLGAMVGVELVPSRGAGWVAAAPGSKTGMVGAKVVLGFGLGFAAGPESKTEDEGLKTGARLRAQTRREGRARLDRLGGHARGRQGRHRLLVLVPAEETLQEARLLLRLGGRYGHGAGAATVFGLLGAKSFRSRPDSGMMPPASDKSGSAKVCLAAGLKSARRRTWAARGGAGGARTSARKSRPCYQPPSWEQSWSQWPSASRPDWPANWTCWPAKRIRRRAACGSCRLT